MNTDIQEKAKNGDVMSQYQLALDYYYGNDTEQDLELAFYWAKKSASQNLAEAQYILGALYMNGEGTSANKEEAIKLFKLSAAQGNTSAKDILEKITLEEKSKEIQPAKETKKPETIEEKSIEAKAPKQLKSNTNNINLALATLSILSILIAFILSAFIFLKATDNVEIKKIKEATDNVEIKKIKEATDNVEIKKIKEKTEKEYYYQTLNVIRDMKAGYQALSPKALSDACNNGWEYLGVVCGNGSNANYLLIRRDINDMKSQEWLDIAIDKNFKGITDSQKNDTTPQVDFNSLPIYTALELKSVIKSNPIEVLNKEIILLAKVKNISSYSRFDLASTPNNDPYDIDIDCSMLNANNSKIKNYKIGSNIVVAVKITRASSGRLPSAAGEVLDIIESLEKLPSFEVYKEKTKKEFLDNYYNNLTNKQMSNLKPSLTMRWDSQAKHWYIPPREETFIEYYSDAQKGDVEAMYLLGACYRLGYGTIKNETEALNWYRKAAEKGHEEAKRFLKYL